MHRIQLLFGYFSFSTFSTSFSTLFSLFSTFSSSLFATFSSFHLRHSLLLYFRRPLLLQLSISHFQQSLLYIWPSHLYHFLHSHLCNFRLSHFRRSLLYFSRQLSLAFDNIESFSKLNWIWYHFVLVNKPRICVPYRIQFNNEKPDNVNFVFILLLYVLATAWK